MPDRIKTKKRTETGIGILLIIGILAVANFASYQIFFRFDLTEGGDYSISRASRQLAAGLDDLVNIKVYFSGQLPPEYITLRQDVADILDEYRNYSNGRIRVQFIDPLEDESVERELLMIGIPQLQFNVYGKDRIEVAKGYLGIAIQHGSRTEVIPVVQNTRNLEYQLSLTIKKVTSRDIPAVGFVASNGALDLQSEIAVAAEKLRDIYELRELDLKEGLMPPGLDTLVVAGPKEPFSEDELKLLDEFLIGGNSILILADGVRVEDGLQPVKNDHNLNVWLNHHGFNLNDNLVIDASAGMASFSQGFMAFTLPYPYWPRVVKSGFDQEHAAVIRLESLILPWASSIDVNAGKIPETREVVELARSSERSWTAADNFNLNPQQNFTPSGELKPRVLAVYSAGEFTGAFGEGKTGSGRLAIVGDSDFLLDRILANTPDNLIFFLNLVDSLTLDEDLINIRSKGIAERPIRELSDPAKAAIRYLNVFGLTVAVLVFGLLRYYLRRRSRFADDL